ncbi:hypothetical protein DE146DRAFT_733069 [Phaeosphaeria sp. MPI-PUGE-AT-0046c]|nr:hypothetical protein DE146DRAFT_733069 [Phaeosphaeria sp. MPI-PUGE-AT-0046c]
MTPTAAPTLLFALSHGLPVSESDKAVSESGLVAQRRGYIPDRCLEARQDSGTLLAVTGGWVLASPVEPFGQALVHFRSSVGIHVCRSRLKSAPAQRPESST